MEPRLTLHTWQGTRATSHQHSISYYWPNPPPAETNTATVWHNFSRKLATTWANRLLWIPSIWGVCDCGTAIHPFQKWFMLSLRVCFSYSQFPSSTTIQESTKWSSIDVVSHTVSKPMDLYNCKEIAHDHENYWSHHIPHYSEVYGLMKWPIKGSANFLAFRLYPVELEWLGKSPCWSHE